MQFRKSNISVTNFEGRSNHKQCIYWQQQEGTKNCKNQNFLTYNKWHGPQTHSYYNPNYANYPHVNNSVRPSPYNVGYQQIWQPKRQNSEHLPIKRHRFQHNYSQPRFHPYHNINNSGRHFNTSQPPAFTNDARRKEPVGRSKIKEKGNNSQQIKNFNRDIINIHLRAMMSPALSTSSSGYSSSSSPTPSTCSEFSLDGLAELPDATLPKPVHTKFINGPNAKYIKSDLVYDVESNSLILTKPYAIVDAPIALAPMDQQD